MTLYMSLYVFKDFLYVVGFF